MHICHAVLSDLRLDPLLNFSTAHPWERCSLSLFEFYKQLNISIQLHPLLKRAIKRCEHYLGGMRNRLSSQGLSTQHETQKPETAYCIISRQLLSFLQNKINSNKAQRDPTWPTPTPHSKSVSPDELCKGQPVKLDALPFESVDPDLEWDALVRHGMGFTRTLSFLDHSPLWQMNARVSFLPIFTYLNVGLQHLYICIISNTVYAIKLEQHDLVLPKSPSMFLVVQTWCLNILGIFGQAVGPQCRTVGLVCGAKACCRQLLGPGNIAISETLGETLYAPCR